MDKFIKCYGWSTVILSGETSCVNTVVAATDIKKIREELSGYTRECIFNVNESGFYFKLRPRKTYITVTENRKTIRGTEAMRSKEPVTVYVFTYAIGNKMSMAVIETLKQFRCLKIAPPPITYFNQKNA